MSWPIVQLGSVITFIRGITFKPEDLVEPYSEDSIVVMRTKNVQIAELSTDDLIAVPKAFMRRDEQKLQYGDLLISSANSWEQVGKASFVFDLGYEATAGGFISIVRPLSKLIDARYLFHWVMSPKSQHKIRHCGRQTTNISNLDVGRFKELEIPLPPLAEQKRIAAILDKADNLRRKRQQAIQLADDFLRAVFLDMFGDPVTNPKGWEVKPLKDMAIVTTGNTPSRKEPDYFGDYIEWIKSDNINTPSHFLTSATEYLSKKGYDVGRHVAAGSTLITCIAGSFDCIGNAAYADREVAFNQQINALTPKVGIGSWFLYALIIFSKKHIQSASTNSMKGMISKGKMEEICFICPPERLQKKFEEIFFSFRSKREKMDLSMIELSSSFSSLSQKAFAGEL